MPASRARAYEPSRPRSSPARRSALEPEEAQELSGGDFDPAGLAAGRGDVLLVGHEPDFSHAVYDLTGARIDMKKGGLAAVDGRTLVSLLRPAQIKRLG